MRFLAYSVIFAVLLTAVSLAGTADAGLLYQASLKNGDYGGGFQVGTGSGYAWGNNSGSIGGNLGALGIVDSPEGVTFTTRSDVINFSLGADGLGGFRQGQFRATGTVSVHFKADLQSFQGGQPFVDNFGFQQFNTGQATFGTGMGRNNGLDGVAYTPDDQVSIGWSTWHNNVWDAHVSTPVLLDFDEWHHLGFAWGGPDNDFEVWVDGVLVSADDLPPGLVLPWGRSNGLGSAYNFALGAIHERGFATPGSPAGVMFADLEIWDEYRAFGATEPRQEEVVPEPTTLALWSLLGVAGLAYGRRRARRSVA